MCLLVVAWRIHPRYRLVVAGNRDEFHERPTAPLDWWADEPQIVAGRDRQAGGTWLGLARSGRFGLVTNFREANTAPPGGPSRGRLVPGFLRRSDAAPAFLDDLSHTASRYSGFNLLVGDAGQLHYYTNVGGERPRSLAPGIYGLSNHQLDEPWPKLVRTRDRFREALADEDPEPGRLFELLADRTPTVHASPPDHALPPDLERALSAPFVRHDRYGTRCSTIVLTAHDGRTTVLERRFDPAGNQTGATRIEFEGSAA